MIRFVAALLMFAIIQACTERKSTYKPARLVTRDQQLFILLTDSKGHLSSDVESVLSGKVFKDSLMIPVSNNRADTIQGEKIKTAKGNTPFTGIVVINNNIADVRLMIFNLDANERQPTKWNGKYELQKEL
jgi:hypothetical protein